MSRLSFANVQAARQRAEDYIDDYRGLQILRETAEGMSRHELVTRSAATAFYAFSALVPFLVVLITLTIVLLPPQYGVSEDGVTVADQVSSNLEANLRRFMPSSAVGVVLDQIARIQQQPPYGLLSIGLVMSIYLASSVFRELSTSLNRIAGAEETRPAWKRYLIAMSMTLIQATILLASLATIVLWPQLAKLLDWSLAQQILATLVQWVVIFLAVLLSFAMAFHLGPSISPGWTCLTPGSLIGTIGFLFTTLLFRTYVQNFGSYDQTYGSLGGIVLLLLWIQLLALILLVSAQVNAVLGRRQGIKNGGKPSPFATLFCLGKSSKPEPARNVHQDPLSLDNGRPHTPIRPESLAMAGSSSSTDADAGEVKVVADIMSESYQTCSRFSSVMEGVLNLKSTDCPIVPIVEDGKPIGVVTARDLAEALTRNPGMATCPISDLMRSEFATTTIDTPLTSVITDNDGREGETLLVLDGEGLLVGVLLWSDLVQHLSQVITGQMVGDEETEA